MNYPPTRRANCSLPAGCAAALFFSLSAITAHGGGFYQSSRHGGSYMYNFYLPPAPSSTPWAPSWSADGKWIVVAMSGSIWRVDPQTGVADELTCNQKHHSLPDCSPDGKWIIYTADDGGQTIQLEILNLESGEIRPLTDDKFLYVDPVFSPDGRRVAYVSTKPKGFFNVYVRPIENGRWAGEETAVTRDNSYGGSRLYFGPWDMHISPAWTADGEELLMVSNRGVPLGSGNVLRAPAVADGIDKAETVLVEQTLYRTCPDVSIDGKRFVYSSTRGAADQFSNLWVLPIVGGEPYKLTFFEHDAFHPRWSPDGEWIAYISNEDGLPQLELLETYGGARRKVRIGARHWRRPMGKLAVRICDASSGETTAARVHVTEAEGKFYFPFDAYARISGAGDRVFYTDGAFEIDLPVGTANLTVVKGFEFRPRQVTAEVQANRVTEMTVQLARVTDLASRGWFSGSTHVHLNYGGNLHNTLDNLMMISAAEDQDVVNVLAANKDNRILDRQLFVKGGGPHPRSTPERLLVVGEEYRPPFYGHVFMLGLKDHLISPFTTGYEGTAIESLYPSNTDMFRKAKAQGATVGYVHAFGGNSDPLERGLGGAKGLMVDAALGTTDAVEWSSCGLGGFYPLYALWNNEFRVAAVGGEDSISDLHQSKLVGSVRTYVYTGNRGLDMDAWFEGLRAGRSFVSTGPLVEFTVNRAMPGETVELTFSPAAGSGGAVVEVEAHIQSITPLKKLAIVLNGETLEEVEIDNGDSSGGRRSIDLTRSIAVDRSGWLHLRVEGAPADRFPLDAAFAQAFTNPVWLRVDGRPVRNRKASEYALQWIDRLQQMADKWPRWRSQTEKDHVFAQFEEARRVYRRRAAEDSSGR